VTDGFAIIDAMQTSRIPVVTVGMGMIASMGVLLLAAGNKGNRIITKNSLIMAHQFAAGAYGKYHELVAAQQGNEIVKRIIMDHFKKHTTMSDKKIERIMFGPSDVYLTPEEVVKYGIADEVRETLMVDEESRDTEE
jgi:ATP-dependent Clp endopeptidase proteolytic subunit ClpP